MSEPTAFFEATGDTLLPTDSSLGPWGPGLLHGGPLAALCVHLAEQLSSPELGSVRLMAEFLRPPTQSPIESHVEMVRSGRRADVVSCELRYDGKLGVRSSLLRVKPVEIDVPGAMRMAGEPPPDRPEEYSPFDTSVGQSPAGIVGLGVEMRVREQIAVAGAGAVWMRMRLPVVEGAEPSTMARICLFSDFGNGLSGPRSESWPPPITFMNADLNVRLLRDEALDWIRIDARSGWSADGRGNTQTRLHDSNGLVAVAEQSLVLQPTR